MFKGFTSELKTKIEQFNRNSKSFIFCLSDLQKSSDRGRDRYGNEESKFDILSSELQQKLENETGVSNPRAIKFVDIFGHTSEDIFSASAEENFYLKTSGVNKYKIWIMFKKKGQNKSLADLNQKNNTRTIYMPGNDTSYKWEIKIAMLDSFLTSKKGLDIEESEGKRINRTEKEAIKKHAENISKVSAEALQEINQTLSECSMSIETAEIDWMALLPNWCSCEVKDINQNNTLHQKHIQNCLWREASEIKTFKDKVVEAILRKGGTKFKDYKNRVIQEIIQKANQQGISEAELNSIRADWKNNLLALNRPKEVVEYRTNQLEKDIEKLVKTKKKSAQERQRAEDEAKENAKKEEERLRKEREEQEKKEEEERKQKEKKETKEKDKRAKEEAKQQEFIKQKRDKVITEINTALNQEPQITNSELSPKYQNWEERIKEINDIQQITNFQDRILADIQARRHDKKTAQEVKENLNKARTGTKEEKEQAWKDLEEQETEGGYQENKEEVEKLKKEKATENPQEYSEEAKQKIEEKLKNNGVKGDELNDKDRQEWQKLKNGEIKDPDQLVEIETKITQTIYQKGVERKVENLTSRVNQVLKSKSDKKSQIAALKQELLQFISSSNIYYSTHKKEIENLLAKLENYSTINNDQNTSKNPQNFPWKIVIPFLLIGLILAIAIPLVRKRIKIKGRKTK